MLRESVNQIKAEYDRIKLNEIVASGGVAPSGPRVQVVSRS